MASNTEQYGIDALFTSHVPDYLKCVACQLVLRNPLQFLDCGHKICTPCFERLKQYTDRSSSLHCPLDGEEVDLQKVVPDNGAKRIVGDLPVKCGNEGCKWNGDLRNLEQHQLQCKFRKQKTETEGKNCDKADASLKALIHRINSCENALQEKDQDIASLKYSLTEVWKTLGEKLGQLDVLKSENEVMKMQMKDVAKIEMKLLALTKELQEKDKTISTLSTQLHTQTRSKLTNGSALFDPAAWTDAVKGLNSGGTATITKIKEPVMDIPNNATSENKFQGRSRKKTKQTNSKDPLREVKCTRKFDNKAKNLHLCSEVQKTRLLNTRASGYNQLLSMDKMDKSTQELFQGYAMTMQKVRNPSKAKQMHISDESNSEERETRCARCDRCVPDDELKSHTDQCFEKSVNTRTSGYNQLLSMDKMDKSTQELFQGYAMTMQKVRNPSKAKQMHISDESNSEERETRCARCDRCVPDDELKSHTDQCFEKSVNTRTSGYNQLLSMDKMDKSTQELFQGYAMTMQKVRNPSKAKQMRISDESNSEERKTRCARCDQCVPDDQLKSHADQCFEKSVIIE